MVNIQLPNKIYEHLQRTAELTKQPLDTVIANSLAHSLPPLLEEIPPEFQADVFPLLEMSDEALQQEILATLSSEIWVVYETLLQHKKNRALSEDEQRQLDKLRYQADLLTFRKGYAAVLLKRRGHSIPTLEDLPTLQ
jgi:hypothetical protein